MRRLIIPGVVLASAALSVPAAALTQQGGWSIGGNRSAIRDPDEKLEHLASASTPASSGHGKPAKSARGILKDDPYLQSAFAWLDNK